MSDEVGTVASLQAALRREQKKLALVQDVGRALSSGLELDALLAVIMEKVTELMAADCSTLYLLADDRRQLWSKVVQGGAVVEIRLAVGEGIAGAVASTGAVINIADAYQDPRFQPAVDLRSGFRTRSMLAVPMRDSLGAMVGVLQVLNKHDGPFVASDEELLTALGNQAAIAIENAKLYHSVLAQNRELTRARAELEALFEVERELSAATDLDDLLGRILAQVTTVVRASGGSIALCEGDKLRFVTSCGSAGALLVGREIPRGQGLMGWAVGQREAVIVEDPGGDPRHDAALAHEVGMAPRGVLVAPLVDGDDVIGGIEIIDHIDPDHTGAGFDDDDLKLLVLIAGQVAKAVALARSRSEASVRDRLASIGQLLASILHDLRTPMTIISGYAQLMAACDDADQRERYASQILRQFELLASMTREVLSFARGDTDLVVRKVYMHRFLEELETQLRAAVTGRGIEVVVVASFDGVAFFDEAKMLRVIHNLARNSVEAMVGGGTLWVTSSVEGFPGHEALVLTIRDDGPGIPPQVQGRLFALFASARKGGTGLGLAIVKKIVDDHGGRIDWSTGDDGTTFRVLVPRDRPEALEVTLRDMTDPP